MDEIMYKTMQRDELLKVLKESQTHLTATKVYEILRQKVPQISLGTVYRNLELLAEQGIISKVQSYSKQKHFESNTNFHFHSRCPICDTIENVSNIDQEISEKLSNSNFEGYILEFTNTCDHCKSSFENSKKLSYTQK